MLTEFLICDETIASLGKTEHDFTIYVLGKESVSAPPRKLKNMTAVGRGPSHIDSTVQ